MPTLYRKRLIPEECVNLKDDDIVHIDKNMIITKWETFRPKAEFTHGISYYVIPQGFKISKFFRADNSLAYIYCDIIDTDYTPETDTYVFTDLLADVIIENDGRIRVVDLDEMGDALTQGIISNQLMSDALHKLNNLLAAIYDGTFHKYISTLDSFMA
ncbi:MAG: DUF402 domain-containing protein [Clostridia bacterium]|nr:DUF402 domain-containing protein [Clostridia bacterium]MDY4741849.1 DUF402 domain-containing protein [Lachnospira sp.]